MPTVSALKKFSPSEKPVLGQAEQEQRKEAQRRVEQHLRRQPQWCGEQPHHRKKHEGAEDRNAYFVRQTHVTAPSE